MYDFGRDNNNVSYVNAEKRFLFCFTFSHKKDTIQWDEREYKRETEDVSLYGVTKG